tara:strand:- start:2217 stop:2402 length:186 start_codon:yes stop_codon:yes gene_type:complete
MKTKIYNLIYMGSIFSKIYKYIPSPHEMYEKMRIRKFYKKVPTSDPDGAIKLAEYDPSNYD